MSLYIYFLMTLLIEMPLVVCCFQRQWKYALLIGFLLNLFTWPLLHVLIFSFGINVNMLELGVALTEGLGYWILLECGWKKAFTVSFLANGLSYWIGLLLKNFQ